MTEPSGLEQAITSFVRLQCDADLIEAVIDTSDARPWLNLWAWDVLEGYTTAAVVREVERTGDTGFLYDVLEERDSLTFQIDVSACYPSWPNDLNRGDEQLMGQLRAALAAVAPAQPSVCLHHVDAWPWLDVRDGRTWQGG